ncbi:hypothetical protein GCM10029992_28310 [Glycomyces albus]
MWLLADMSLPAARSTRSATAGAAGATAMTAAASATASRDTIARLMRCDILVVLSSRAERVAGCSALMAPPSPAPERNMRWNTRNKAMGIRVEMASAARKTSSSTKRWSAGRRTDSGWRSGSGSTSIGHRKSFQDRMTAKTETTPMIGRDIGRTIDQNRR